MTAKAVAPKIRPLSTTFEIDMPDEAGRIVQFRVQIDARRISCWTTETHVVGSLTFPELYAYCCAAKSRELK
jgi:hypothetical protein